MSGSVASPSFQSNRSVGSASASASAFSGNRSFSGGNFNRHHGDFRHHHHHRGNFAFAAVPFGFYDDGYYNDYAYDYDDYDGCYQLRRVHTRYGWRLRRIDVCNYAY
jgi:hypothetical protein